MVQASKAIGNTELENKFAAAITAIKRDIVFAPSLVRAPWIKLTVVLMIGIECGELGSFF